MGEDRPGRCIESRTLSQDRPRADAATRYYGRRVGRPLRPGRAALLDKRLPELSVPDPANGPIDPSALFDAPKRALWLEIGFGAGEHLIWQAEHNPDVGLIGAEPFLNGLTACIAAIDDSGVQNVRLHGEDARPLLEALPEASVDKLFVLHPDPWRKRRHWERRIIGPQGLDLMARVLADGAELRTATDHAGYQIWMLRHLRADQRFEWLAEMADDWRVRPDDWPETRYAAKAVREGRPIAILRFKRRPRAA